MLQRLRQALGREEQQWSNEYLTQLNGTSNREALTMTDMLNANHPRSDGSNESNERSIDNINNNNYYTNTNTNNNDNNTNEQSDEECCHNAAIKLRSTGYTRTDDGSVILSVALDKDQIECIFCCTSASVCWKKKDLLLQNRRMKNANGHAKQIKCPICKTEGIFKRHRALERQLKEIYLPCQNHKLGCSEKFFPWDDIEREEHLKICMFGPVWCPFCLRSIPGGRSSFVSHLRKTEQVITTKDSNGNDLMSQADLQNAKELREIIDVENEENSNAMNNDIESEEHKQNASKLQSVEDLQKNNAFTVPRTEDSYYVNDEFGYVLIFLAPTVTDNIWKVYCISISPHHNISGNNRVYISYWDEKEFSRYDDIESHVGVLGEALLRPVQHQLIINMARLSPASFNLFAKSEHLKMNSNTLKNNSQFWIEFPEVKTPSHDLKQTKCSSWKVETISPHQQNQITISKNASSLPLISHFGAFKIFFLSLKYHLKLFCFISSGENKNWCSSSEGGITKTLYKWNTCNDGNVEQSSSVAATYTHERLVDENYRNQITTALDPSDDTMDTTIDKVFGNVQESQRREELVTANSDRVSDPHEELWSESTNMEEHNNGDTMSCNHTDEDEEDSVKLYEKFTSDMTLGDCSHPYLARSACTPLQAGVIYAGVKGSCFYLQSLKIR
ncbi:hypothetical protein RFI_25941, partial [Reticulomyxa filosa]